MPSIPATQQSPWGCCPAPGSPECLYLHDFIGPDAGVELQALHLGDVGAQAAVLSCGGGEQAGEHPLALPGELVPGGTHTLPNPRAMYWPAHCLQMTTQRLMDAQSGF